MCKQAFAGYDLLWTSRIAAGEEVTSYTRHTRPGEEEGMFINSYTVSQRTFLGTTVPKRKELWGPVFLSIKICIVAKVRTNQHWGGTGPFN